MSKIIIVKKKQKIIHKPTTIKQIKEKQRAIFLEQCRKLEADKLKKIVIHPVEVSYTEPTRKKTRKTIKKIKRKGGFYKSIDWINQRNRILKRDNYKCVECGKESNLHVHHTKYRFKSEQDKDLITLCRYCHAAKHPVNRLSILSC
jgi:5-methylcytosine-specific restriction endonuclease McrA